MKKSEIYFLFNKPLMGRLKPFWIFKPTALSIQLDCHIQSHDMTNSFPPPIQESYKCWIFDMAGSALKRLMAEYKREWNIYIFNYILYSI